MSDKLASTLTPREITIAIVVIPKLLICQNTNCLFSFAAHDMQVFPDPVQLMNAMKEIHKKEKPLCLAPRLLVLYDNALLEIEATPEVKPPQIH